MAEMKINTIIRGDCLEVMRTFAECSIDTIITDPPYGIGFMGKEWDTFKPSNVEKEKKRDTRTQKRRKLYGGRESDRPSAAMAAARYDFSRNAEFQQWFTVWGVEALRVLKPGGTMLIFGGTRTYHRLACGIEDAGFILKDCIMWLYGSGFPKATDISKQLDKGHEREIVGVNPSSRPNSKKRNAGGFDSQKGDGSAGVQNITAPATPEAQLWNGWKSHGLKPAYEPILVAMKANDGSYANNALKHGVAGLNIDAGRIEFASEADKQSAVFGRGTDIMGGNYVGAEHGNGKTNIPPDDKGRYPANVILDNAAAAMLDEQSGIRPAGGKVTGKQKSCTGDTGIYGHYEAKENSPFNDTGGAARFFYCAKASKSERNEGCGDLELKAPPYGNNMSSCDKGTISDSKLPVRNHHPTVKPLELMEYLCKLTSTPTSGLVLDPFAGSGTTLLAAYRTGRDYIGIEKEPEYKAIAEKRIEAEKDKLALFER